MIQRFVVCLAIAAAAAQGGEILTNPGFETGSLSPWFNAFGAGTGVSDWAVTSTNCHSGSFCAEDNGNIELEQTFSPVAVGSITDISFWALHPDSAVTDVAFDLLYLNGSDDEFVVDTSGTDWNFFDVFSNLESTGSLTGFAIFGNTQGVTMADDFSITTAGSAVPEPATAGLLLAGLAVLVFIAERRRRTQIPNRTAAS